MVSERDEVLEKMAAVERGDRQMVIYRNREEAWADLMGPDEPPADEPPADQ